MDIQDSVWRQDDGLRAEKVYVGLARDQKTLEGLGVVIALGVKDFKGGLVSVTAAIPPDQAMEIADAIHAAVRDIELAT